MVTLAKYFENNRKWVAENLKKDPDFFSRLTEKQNPELLWIGCSDSRVPANEIIGLMPGELFVHRNVANIVMHSDMNCQSVIQYAIDILKIKDIVVCGHYGCGGVKAVLEVNSHGLVDNWLIPIKNIYNKNIGKLHSLELKEKVDKLCELNVIQQVLNVCKTTTVQEAWMRGQKINVHGWIYAISDGLLKDMNCCISSLDELSKIENDN